MKWRSWVWMTVVLALPLAVGATDDLLIPRDADLMTWEKATVAKQSDLMAHCPTNDLINRNRQEKCQAIIRQGRFQKEASEACIAEHWSMRSDCFEAIRDQLIPPSVIEFCRNASNGQKGSPSGACFRHMAKVSSVFNRRLATFCLKRNSGSIAQSHACLSLIRDRKVDDVDSVIAKCSKSKNLGGVEACLEPLLRFAPLLDASCRAAKGTTAGDSSRSQSVVPSEISR